MSREGGELIASKLASQRARGRETKRNGQVREVKAVVVASSRCPVAVAAAVAEVGSLPACIESKIE